MKCTKCEKQWIFSVLPGILSDVCGGCQSVGGLGSQRAGDFFGFRLNVHA